MLLPRRSCDRGKWRKRPTLLLQIVRERLKLIGGDLNRKPRLAIVRWRARMHRRGDVNSAKVADVDITKLSSRQPAFTQYLGFQRDLLSRFSGIRAMQAD